MPANKCYSTRERVLDRLLRKEEGATVAEMMTSCNETLRDEGFKEISAQNTILNDMENIENRYGKAALIEKLRDPKDRRSIRYRYANRRFSIYKVELTDDEAACLRSAIDLLSRFQGLPQNSWIGEMDIRLRSFLKADPGGRPVVGFDSNPEYSGNRFLQPLFQAITSQQSLSLHIAPFQDQVYEINVWPYYLKQSRHTWHLIAGFIQNGELASIPLDSIVSLTPLDTDYRPCTADLEQFISQRIGASHGDLCQEPLSVTFSATPEAQRFLLAAPMHPTQQVIRTLDNGDAILQIDVVCNVELLFELCKYGGHITVLSPPQLRQTIAQMHAEALQRYE